jgi:hypothetical protein
VENLEEKPLTVTFSLAFCDEYRVSLVLVISPEFVNRWMQGESRVFDHTPQPNLPRLSKHNLPPSLDLVILTCRNHCGRAELSSGIMHEAQQAMR